MKDFTFFIRNAIHFYDFRSLWSNTNENKLLIPPRSLLERSRDNMTHIDPWDV